MGTAALGNTAPGTPFAVGVDGFVYPQFIGYAQRAPTARDIENAGTRWQDNSVNPAVIYETTGSGLWYTATAGGSGAFTSLTVTPGPASITGTTNINTTGAGVTTIGTGGTGATNIGNATGNTVVTGNETVTGSITSTLGNITATNGNFVLGTAGNKLLSTSVATTTAAGANSFGTVALVGGTATVATTAVTAASLIYATVQALGTVTTPQAIAITAKTAGTSFVITSAGGTDTSTVAWFIVN